MSYPKNHNNYLLLAVFIVVSSVGLLSPVLNSNDAYFYADIAKTMSVNHDWVNLYFNNADWLDKPHFPFWMTALSFSIFGVNAFAYVLPGFIFHLIGACYTYRLAKELFDDNIARIALVIYLSALHLMLSAMDIRAEAYLLGEILPACFYWLRYDREGKIKNLLLAGLFTGLALMTKGLFVIFTIFSGQAICWLYTKQYNKLFSLKFALAIVVSFLFALPELICLYLQFDLHPDKIIFGGSGVSGIWWYFWGSQFGRFFNTGPIVNKGGDPFFFVHTFLWAFLPWSLVFIVAVYTTIRLVIKKSTDIAKLVYLHGSFWPTFLLFSATKFQLDHYTNILMPFAAILVAYFIVNLKVYQLNLLAKFQVGLSILLLVLNIIIIYIFPLGYWRLIILLPVFLIGLFMINYNKHSELTKIIALPAVSIGSIFIVLMLINATIYSKYDAGYNLGNYFKSNQITQPIYIIDANKVGNSLYIHSNNLIYSINTIANIKNNSYLLINHNLVDKYKLNEKNNGYHLVATFVDIPMERFIHSMLSQSKYQQNLTNLDLYMINK